MLLKITLFSLKKKNFIYLLFLSLASNVRTTDKIIKLSHRSGELVRPQKGMTKRCGQYWTKVLRGVKKVGKRPNALRPILQYCKGIRSSWQFANGSTPFGPSFILNPFGQQWTSEVVSSRFSQSLDETSPERILSLPSIAWIGTNYSPFL